MGQLWCSGQHRTPENGNIYVAARIAWKGPQLCLGSCGPATGAVPTEDDDWVNGKAYR